MAVAAAPIARATGLAHWSEADLIAQVVGGAEPAMDVMLLAEQLARVPFWQRRALGVSGLVSEYGIPERYAVRLAALWELADRWFPDDRPALSSPEQALVLVSALGEEPIERAVVLMLDPRYHPKEIETVAVGSTNVARLRVRDVIGPAMRAEAAAIVVAHNHPSGDPHPSQADRRITAALREAADVVGIALLDHLIVARRRHYSFRRAEQWSAGPSWLCDEIDGY